ncbi:MAG TPA: hypothetical protein VHK70_08205 [Burkholderiaceae bacterium]|nr:hypothetical protein [Burkholderiaceae bacterium]
MLEWIMLFLFRKTKREATVADKPRVTASAGVEKTPRPRQPARIGKHRTDSSDFNGLRAD